MKTPLAIRRKLNPGPDPIHPFNLNKLDYEWQIGYEWYMSRMEGDSVLDGGCLAHLEFDRILAHLGYRVYSVDIAAYPNSFSGFTFYHNFIWSIPCPDKMVDTILCNSLFEHLGLPYYDQPVKTDADFETSAEFHRVLKPNGCLLMQVPYGKNSRIINHKGQPFYRIYDSTRLHELLYGLFDVEDCEFFMHEQGKWVNVSVDVANRIDYREGLPPCLVYIKARKHD